MILSAQFSFYHSTQRRDVDEWPASLQSEKEELNNFH